MARRSDHTREELKELILESSWKIVGQEGFEGLTARQIAKEIGYAPGTIYNLFESMHDLYVHIHARTLDLLFETLNSPECNDASKSPADNLKAMAGVYMGFAQEYRPYWLMLFQYSWPEDRQTMDWYQEKIDRLFGPLEHLLAPFFKAEQDRKKKIAARVLWGSVHGLCLLQETDKIAVVSGDKAATHMTDYLIDTFIKGIE